jgi:hypothetical protein
MFLERHEELKRKAEISALREDVKGEIIKATKASEGQQLQNLENINSFIW